MRRVIAVAVLCLSMRSSTIAARGVTSVVSTVAAVTLVSEDDRHPSLVVVWKGSPGWMENGHRAGSGGASGRTFHWTESFGGTQLDLDFDFATRVAHLAGHDVSLGADNVILFDRVDERDRSTVVRTLSLDVQKVDAGDVYPVLALSNDLAAYIQCDAKSARPSAMDLIGDWCAPLLAAGAKVAAPPESEVRVALQHYAQLVRQMDNAGIAAMFAADGEIMNPGRDPIKGPQAIEAFLKEFAGYQVIEEVMVPSRLIFTRGGGNQASTGGFYRQRVRTPDGSVLDVGGAFQIDWVRDASGVWRIQRAATFPRP